MKRRTQVLLGVLLLLLLLAVAGFFFVRYEIRKSFPVTEGTVAVGGIVRPVDVARDEYGVPHIIAADEHDLLFALGYVHAQDRLWQMDMERRAGEGRLSELFGRGTVPFDRMFRTIGLRRIAERLEQALTADCRQRLEWYAQGVNAYIDSHNGKYPVEFDMLGYSPEPWTPLHSVLLARLMAWELNISWWADLTLGEIAERVGLQNALDVFPTYPANVLPAVPAAEWQKLLALGSGFLTVSHEYRSLTGPASAAGGSNAWAVAPRRSMTGGALLANDTHLHLTLPGKWYEVLLRTHGGCVRGMTIPGTPGVIAGRNDSIAWGITSLMLDEADFYVEEIDTAGGGTYRYGKEWLPLETAVEEIAVRGDTAQPVVIRRTHHGPIVSDIRAVLQKFPCSHAVSMRWTGAEVDDPFDAFFKINRAGNWDEFSAGVQAFAVPAQNFIYCDVRGNIGHRVGMRLPVRPRQSSMLPLPGWDQSAEWKGFVAPGHFPYRYNPPEGYVASANNKLADASYPYYLSDLWESPSRIQRLRESLGKPGDRFTVMDFEMLQNDKFSIHAMEIVPFIFAACRDSAFVFPEKERVLEYLRNWNFTFSRDDIVTSLYQAFFVRLLENTFKDELGPDLYYDYVLLGNVPQRVITRLLHEGTSVWFDDVTTPEVEGRDEIIRKSLRGAVEFLTRRCGSEMRLWRWGTLHTVTLVHPFGLVSPLDRIFSLGPYEIGGASTVLASGEYSYNEPFAFVVGPSFRQIFDMANGDEARVVIPAGQSGQVFNEHYDDQLDLWLNGAYRIARSMEAEGRWHHLVLEPAR